ncbi:MAG: fluoride efflux transporter FluC [Planctomycetia bacterium]|jgi:CrcB protein
MHPLTTALWLGLAGAAGTLLRAGLTTLAVRLLGPEFPWGTLLVNVAGSFACGALWAARLRGLSTETETILLVGLLGGFTTYSSFAFQSVEMLSGGRPAAAIGYLVATNLLALAACWAGLRLAG